MWVCAGAPARLGGQQYTLAISSGVPVPPNPASSKIDGIERAEEGSSCLKRPATHHDIATKSGCPRPGKPSACSLPPDRPAPLTPHPGPHAQMATSCSSSSSARLAGSRWAAARCRRRRRRCRCRRCRCCLRSPALRRGAALLRSTVPTTYGVATGCRHALAPAAPLRAAARQPAGARRLQRRLGVTAAAEVEEDLWQFPDREQWYHAKWWVLGSSRRCQMTQAGGGCCGGSAVCMVVTLLLPRAAVARTGRLVFEPLRWVHASPAGARRTSRTGTPPALCAAPSWRPASGAGAGRSRRRAATAALRLLCHGPWQGLPAGIASCAVAAGPAWRTHALLHAPCAR